DIYVKNTGGSITGSVTINVTSGTGLYAKGSTYGVKGENVSGKKGLLCYDTCGRYSGCQTVAA
ncbi:MAG: hypothetical protein KJ985_09130, partial [Proteobacteria bacterium]|nr:hypothetical protein [Pseudomonadota bacterium]